METTTTARTARCTYFSRCGNEAPSSSPHLAFFEDRSQPKPTESTCCGYSKLGHDVFDGKAPGVLSGKWPANLEPHAFVPRTAPWPYDSYYCGCFGWD